MNQQPTKTWANGQPSRGAGLSASANADDAEGSAGPHDHIAELIQQIDRLSQSEKRNRLLLSSLPQKVFFKDCQSRLVSVNDVYARELGQSPDELVGKTDFDLFPPELATKYQADDLRVMRSRQAVTLEERHQVGDCETFVEVTKAPVIDDDGQVIGLMGMFTDITARKKGQAALKRQAAQLAQQASELEARNGELTTAYAELQEAEAQLIHSEKMAAIGQLVAGLAHEINNPVAYVLTNLSAIQRDLDDVVSAYHQCRDLCHAHADQLPTLQQQCDTITEAHSVDLAMAELNELLSSCREGMVRIRDLVANLRGYSRIDTRGDMGLNNINDGVKSTLKILGPTISKEITVDMQLGDLPLVECNLGQINQVLMNLFVNAVQAMPTGGTLTIATLAPDSDSQHAKTKGQVVITVRDTGKGIPEDIKHRIFNPFFTTKPMGEGTGLGLSIARRIVDAHQGVLDFQSHQNQGTQFALKLPLRQPEPLSVSEPDSLSAS